MSRFYSLDELKDEPVFIPYEDDGKPLAKNYTLTPEQWHERYVFMREEYIKYLWFYSPICAKVLGMRELLRHLCRAYFTAAEKSLPEGNLLEEVRDMDLALGLITQEQYGEQEEAQRREAMKYALRDAHANNTVNRMCEKIRMLEENSAGREEL